MRTACRLAALTLAVATLAGSAHAQLKKSDSVVKIEAKGNKIADDGTQVVTFTLTVDKGWHLYANPVGNPDLLDNQVTVALSSKTKLQDVKVAYPAGTVVKDDTVGDYRIYAGTVKITATVQRQGGLRTPGRQREAAGVQRQDLPRRRHREGDRAVTCDTRLAASCCERFRKTLAAARG